MILECSINHDVTDFHSSKINQIFIFSILLFNLESILRISSLSFAIFSCNATPTFFLNTDLFFVFNFPSVPLL